MKTATCLKTSGWLKTDDPVVPVDSATSAISKGTGGGLFRLQAALREGVCATPDLKRSGFYDVELDNGWYYIHIPAHMLKVYVVAYRPQTPVSPLRNDFTANGKIELTGGSHIGTDQVQIVQLNAPVIALRLQKIQQ